ncbi:MAG: glycosyltransferase family 4 protein [Candidatus Eremiobacteraeota bacterium]|nr:glycosyltransferase family 4 protein [Candidatus Eremiobacteraeota bacterium]
MKIAIDAQLTVGTATGIGEYIRGLCVALREAGTEVVELQEPALDPWRFDRRLLWDQLLLPLAARKSHAELLHCAAGTMPLLSGLPMVVTVHDVAWLKVQAHAPAYSRWYFGRFSLRRYRRANHIVVDSHFSRSELLPMLDIEAHRVSVVYPGVSADFFRIVRCPSASQTILVVGTVERRKNLGVLIRALPAVPGATIVSIGPSTPYQHECEELARLLGVRDRLQFRGYVSRIELLQWYARCAVAAVPSEYEGFGYAAAQALAAGVPLVVSDASSLPEIAGGDAMMVAAESAEAWAAALQAALTIGVPSPTQERASRERAAKRFGWAASALSMRELFQTVLQHQ